MNRQIIKKLHSVYLPIEYKQALILTEFENLTQKALSERIGLSLPGAKSSQGINGQEQG
jgi:DNA-directed RNA polymerase specialized sigma24 family protein